MSVGFIERDCLLSWFHSHVGAMCGGPATHLSSKLRQLDLDPSQVDMRGSGHSSSERSVGGAECHPEGYADKDKLPIVYSDAYNISFYGLEKVHPFDAGKWGKVFAALRRAGLLTDNNFHKPHEATNEELLVVHTPSYINKLKWSAYVATVTEVPFMAVLPNCMVQRRVLRPFRYQTAGTVLAARLALEHGWAVHLGGGFHHASSHRGGGFCCYADITLAVRELQRQGHIRRVMVVDLDAHQGNGYARDFLGDMDVYIMDVYNRAIYPGDEYAKGAIRRRVELRPGTSDEAYLKLVDDHLQLALTEFSADLVVYNAGTDVLSGDMLGHLNISEKGVVQRDALVFPPGAAAEPARGHAHQRRLPAPVGARHRPDPCSTCADRGCSPGGSPRTAQGQQDISSSSTEK
ncbi:histone deacetylase 11 isoform X1 [Amblyomma americanum]